MRRRPRAAILLAALAAGSLLPRRAVAQERTGLPLGELVAGLGSSARVLMIGAHPDDEDNRMLAWFARGRHVETAYLSLNRGEGGQNLIGNELDEALGVLRTEELLAARRIDGAHQYFTRAYDFGFSKSAAESFQHWPHDSVLNDVVTIVRAFRPQIIISVFSGTPRDGHGQHQVAGILAREAFDQSGDTVRFPVARFGPAWTVSKFYRDRSYWGGEDATLSIDVGEYSTLLHESYAAVAARARSQHRSQGFGSIVPPAGPVMGYLRRDATRVNAGTDPKAERSVFDGLDTDSSMASGDCTACATDRFRRAVAVANDVVVTTAADRAELALGDTAEDTVRVVAAGHLASTTVHPVVGAHLTAPWWLATPRAGDLYTVPVSRVAEDARVASPMEHVHMDDPPVTLDVPVERRSGDPTRGEVDRPLAIVPTVSVTLDQVVAYVPARARVDRTLHVLLRSGSPRPRDVALSMHLPTGLATDSATWHMTLAPFGVRRVDVPVHGTLGAGSTQLSVTVTCDGQTFGAGYIPIEYDHIRPQKLYRPATIDLHAVDITVPADLSVAYIPGVGDNVEPALEQIGLRVTVVDPATLGTTDLSRFHTVVVGPRAYEASADLRANNARLLDYARRGGTLVVQYGQYEMTDGALMPYPITLSRPHDRVTDENAPVRVLDARSPVLLVPNRITDADFAGWIQDRSLYMPHTFDKQYHAVLSMNDPGEPANDGTILVTPLGRGTYIYTTLAFFRQLPAGVPGAARLFVNLLAAGRP
jgi:LmbE family N-acetylglucosaminyl deacetylase